MLNDEYALYLETLQQPPYRGLRINTLKIGIDEFQKLDLYALKPTPFAKDSFYLDAAVSGVGNHPSHLSGMIYLQEWSLSPRCWQSKLARSFPIRCSRSGAAILFRRLSRCV